MITACRNPIHDIIADFAPRHVAKPRVLVTRRKSDRAVLADLGVDPIVAVAMPDVAMPD